MPRGIPNAKPAPVESDEAELNRMIAEEEAEKAAAKLKADAEAAELAAKAQADSVAAAKAAEEKAAEAKAAEEKKAAEAAAAKPKLVPVRLLRNYRPMSDVFEIVGYHKEAIIRKRPDGKMVTVEEGGFFKETGDDGEIVGAPPAMVGTGFSDRLNVGTVVRLPRDEAKRARDLKIGELELDD